MLQFFTRRLAFLMFVVVGITLLTFVISHIIPADPAAVVAGPNAREEQIQELRKLMKLDRPLHEQYLRYLTGLLRGDLGTSVRSHRPVRDHLSQLFPATLELTLVAMILYTVVGVPLGILIAVRQGTWVDSLTRIAALAGVALPEFWLALVLQLIFYRQLGWLPSGGRLDVMSSPPQQITGLYLVDSVLTLNGQTFVDSLRHLVLPAIALTMGRIATLIRITRVSIIHILSQDYIRVARAKGLREWTIISHHALKNALVPIITIIGLQVGWLLNGAVLVETVFSWPGVGQYAVTSISF